MLGPVAAALIATAALAPHAAGCAPGCEQPGSAQRTSHANAEYAGRSDGMNVKIGFTESAPPQRSRVEGGRILLDADPAVGGAPLTVHFRAALVGSHGTTQPMWDFGDGQTRIGGSAPVHTYHAPGTYEASVTVQMHGVAKTQRIQVEVRAEAFEVEIHVDRDIGSVPLDTIFDVSVVDEIDGPFVYDWDFGDGNASQRRSPRHTYRSPGDYQALVTVTAPTGQIGRDRFEINALPPFDN